ncbi:hypothetical protein CLIB1423_09S01002 [[Candida] railenensis]|uniref:Uncharacterized protein n=1 Tax=[Candida] railenensis TaxID=45579 RepID=A0A9P0VYH9_9ASCO|nr:hypothetical protein CLIB1423_09S01002 [[Candida] railenensis]
MSYIDHSASRSTESNEIPPPYEQHQSQPTGNTCPEKDDAPIVTMKPIQFNGKVVDWDFMAYNDGFSHDILTFVSQDAREKYKTFKGSVGYNYKRALELQREGFAMPLLRAEHHSLAQIHSTRYMTIYKYTPPPTDKHKLFDKYIDRFVFCEVKKERHASYDRYKLTFTPDPKNPKEGFILFMIDHERYPIIDISTYKGRRFRFVTGYSWFRCKWSYLLSAIPDGEPSLTDDISKDGKVNKKNPLLGNSLKNFLLGPSTRFNKDFLGVPIGVALETSEYFHSLHLHAPVRFAFQGLMNDGAEVSHTESINSVSIDSLVFLCMVSIFKREEEHKSRNEKR